MRLFVSIGIIMTCVFVSGAIGQIGSTAYHGSETNADSLTEMNQSLIGFERNLTTYLWTGRLAFDQSAGLFNLSFKDLYRSSIIKTTDTFIKDEHNATSIMTYKLSDDVKAQVNVSTLLQSDNRNYGASDVTSNQLLGGFSWQKSPFVDITPLVGYRWDKQLNIIDRGLSYSITGRVNDYDISGYRFSFQGRLTADQISPRQNHNDGASLTILKNFSEEARNTLHFQLSSAQRDFYFPADSMLQQAYNVRVNIDSRREKIYGVNDELQYHFDKNLATTINFGLTQRTIERSTSVKDYEYPSASMFDSDVDEFRLETQLQLSYTTSSSFLIGRIQYSERDETHTIRSLQGVDSLFYYARLRDERENNNIAARTSVAILGSTALGYYDRVEGSFTTSILRYDTPDSDNVEDRDELMIITDLSEEHVFSQCVRARLNVDVVLNHFVYLFSQRSANNNWNRIIRLSPRIEYTPVEWFTTTTSFEVLANYTVYDFEERLQSIQSYSFRQFSCMDTTLLKPAPHIEFFGIGGVKLSERGQLFWQDFKERPVDYFREYLIHGILRYKAENVTFSSGFRIFLQDRFGYQGTEKNLVQRIVNLGPTCSVDWLFNPDATLSFSGWYEIQQQTGIPDRSIPNVSLRILFSL